MDAKWDLTFACDIKIVNDHIRAERIPFLKSFIYQSKGGSLSGSIPVWRIGWAGNEQYMAIEMELKNVTIECANYSENYPVIRSTVNIQYAFAEKASNKLGFICKSEATSSFDPTIGAIWVAQADMDAAITNEILAIAYPSLLNSTLPE